jgi:ATP-binding cassette, subfamily B, bacterial
LKKFLRQLYEVYRPLRFAVLGILGFIATSQVLNLITPYLTSKVIDGLVKKQPAEHIYLFVTGALVLWVFRVTAFRIWRERYELKRIDGAIPQRMQEFTLHKLFGFSIGQHTSENSGIKQSIISRGENALENMIQLFVYQALPLVVEILILTSVLLYMAPAIGSIVLVCLVVCIAFIWKLNTSFKGNFKEIERLYIRDSKFEGEVVRNIGLVMAQAQETRAIKECRESLSGAYAYARGVWTRFINWAALRDCIPQVARFLVMVVGIQAVLSERYTLGQFVMFISWTTNALGNLGEMSSLHRQMIRSYTSIKRYFDMLSIEPDVKVLDNPVRPDKFSGRIEFKNVTFRYHSRDAKGQTDGEEDEPKPQPKKSFGPALDNVSFVVESGQTVAFVGESGAGKSTLVNALIQAQDPETGQIIVDGNDLRVLDLKHFRESIGIVNQDVSLFDHTLRYNITYGLNGRGASITDPELHAVAEASRIDRFYERLEKGFDTIIGERGIKLSGGERQRVGIARALIKEPDILIFDEATSNLDSENEAMIRESIEKASHGRTTIIIAHRFSTIKNVDKVFVFDKGKLVGEGSHNELTQNCAEYRRLVKNQMEIVNSI